MRKQRRLVITGMGAVTPLGNSVEEFWNGLISSQSSVSQFLPTEEIRSQLTPEELSIQYPYEKHFSEDFLTKCGTTIGSFVKQPVMVDRRDQREVPKFVAFSQEASLQALKHAHWDPSTWDPLASATILGTGIGNLDDICDGHNALQTQSVRKISPYFVSRILPSSASGWVGKGIRVDGSENTEFPSRGGVMSCVGACATGQMSIIQGAQLLHSDPSIHTVLCGATETPVHPVAMAGFSRMKALSRKWNDQPEKASRPFDKQRDGFVMGEGAGVVCLEDLDHALERNAPILAELRGFATSGDGYHMSQPPEDGSGVLHCMKKALSSAGLSPSHIDYVSAHATSTPLGDQSESFAIGSLIGNERKDVAVSSIKGHIGHLLGAAGIVQTIACVMALQQNLVPPTLNLDEIDVQDFGFQYVKEKALSKPVNAVLSNSFGFGGMNTSLVLTKPPV